MLNVKKVKDNIQLTFIEKFFTNREIETSVQTRYLRFKGTLYEGENFLCDIRCVQLQKVLARFQCGNTQLEVVRGSARFVKGRAICKEALSRLRFGEGRG
jgi:hypothetical protein